MIYSFAAFFATLLTAYFFFRVKVPNLLETIGLRSSGENRVRWPKALAKGLFWGLLAAVFAVFYLNLIELSPMLQELKKQSLQLFSNETERQIGWLALLMLVAAPLFEEYIFRGLVFRGMRRTSRPVVAIVGSAVVFAMAHPAISALPVFGLGIAAAIAFERSGLLIAPIAAHVTYNAAVLAAQMAGKA